MCCEIGGSVKSVQGLNNDISECPSKSYNPKPQAVGTAAPPTFIHVQHTICKRQPIRKKWSKLKTDDSRLCLNWGARLLCTFFIPKRFVSPPFAFRQMCKVLHCGEPRNSENCSPLRSWINSQEHQWSILFKAHCNHAEETSIIGKTLQVHLNLRKVWF